jgi:hypothetical protein
MKHRDDLLWQRAERDLGATPERRAAVDGLVVAASGKPRSSGNGERLGLGARLAGAQTTSQARMRVRQFAAVAAALLAVTLLAARAADWIWPEQATAVRALHSSLDDGVGPEDRFLQLLALSVEWEFLISTLADLSHSDQARDVVDKANATISEVASGSGSADLELLTGNELVELHKLATDISSPVQGRVDAIVRIGSAAAARSYAIRSAAFDDRDLAHKLDQLKTRLKLKMDRHPARTG